MDCLFCKIVKGEISSAKVYEDNYVLAFLDISPNTEGHCLVIPKQHFEDMFAIDSETLKKVTIVVKNLATKIKESLGAKGMNITNNNGQIGDQLVPHFHFHIIPRYENDGLVMYGPRPGKEKKLTKEEQEKILAKIK